MSNSFTISSQTGWPKFPHSIVGNTATENPYTYAGNNTKEPWAMYVLALLPSHIFNIQSLSIWGWRSIQKHSQRRWWMPKWSCNTTWMLMYLIWKLLRFLKSTTILLIIPVVPQHCLYYWYGTSLTQFSKRTFWTWMSSLHIEFEFHWVWPVWFEHVSSSTFAHSSISSFGSSITSFSGLFELKFWGLKLIEFLSFEQLVEALLAI